MGRFNRVAVIASVVVAVAAGALVCAVPAQAGGFGDPLTSTDKAIIIRTTDLRADAGEPISVASLQWGKGVAPSGCVLLDAGKSKGRPAPRSFYREILAAPGVRWQNAIYQYPTVDAAIRSYEQLLDGSLATCTGQSAVTENADGDKVASTSTMSSRMLPNTSQDRPRFTVSTGWVMQDPASAPRGAADRYSYTCFMLVDKAIVDVTVFAPKPISAAQKADVLRITNVVGKRYARNA